MPVLEKYLRPIRNASLEVSFQAWQSLGNRHACDDSYASGEVAACIQLASPVHCTGKVGEAESLEPPESSLLREALGYSKLLQDLGIGPNSVSSSSVEKLLSVCTPENRRVAKVLAGLGCLVGQHPGEVPGLDYSASYLSAAAFFAEVPDWELAASLLPDSRWSLPHAYFLAGQVLMSTGHLGAAEVAWEMGSGMGDEACMFHLVALEFLKIPSESSGTNSTQRFRVLQRASERGFQLPLVAASWALELGVGVDQDLRLASTYMTLATMNPLPETISSIVRHRRPSRGISEKEPRPLPGALPDLLFNWASKHPHDPVHQIAAREWHRLRQRN